MKLSGLVKLMSKAALCFELFISAFLVYSIHQYTVTMHSKPDTIMVGGYASICHSVLKMVSSLYTHNFASYQTERTP